MIDVSGFQYLVLLRDDMPAEDLFQLLKTLMISNAVLVSPKLFTGLMKPAMRAIRVPVSVTEFVIAVMRVREIPVIAVMSLIRVFAKAITMDVIVVLGHQMVKLSVLSKHVS